MVQNHTLKYIGFDTAPAVGAGVRRTSASSRDHRLPTNFFLLQDCSWTLLVSTPHLRWVQVYVPRRFDFAQRAQDYSTNGV